MSNNCEEVDIVRYRGDTRAELFNIWSLRNRADLNIADYEFLLTVNEVENPGNPNSTELFQITGLIISESEGEVAFSLSSAQADNVGEYFYDIQMTDDSGGIETIRKGKWIMLQDITK